mgnify:CR=1 FL=1
MTYDESITEALLLCESKRKTVGQLFKLLADWDSILEQGGDAMTICTILPCKVCGHTFFAHTFKCSDCPKKSTEAQHTYVRRESDNR